MRTSEPVASPFSTASMSVRVTRAPAPKMAEPSSADPNASTLTYGPPDTVSDAVSWRAPLPGT